ncbi:MAG TPA: toll/interleukin-1 receptor domain-containing protein [Bryobacteraceae bacterium]|nr:toll/interleukin-1 receptor domain-containing protein [Bryobacteraceae bacterium]
MTTPLRVLCVFANPTDLPRYEDGALWQTLQSAANDTILIERLAKPTENALRQRLTEREWDVLHIAAHAQARGEAHYASVALEASDGRARSLTGSYLAEFLAPFRSLRAVVLHLDAADSICALLASTLAAEGRAVMVKPLGKSIERSFVTALYAELQTREVVAAPQLVAPAPRVEEVPPWWKTEVERKRAAQQFDVFLCHHSPDKPSVALIAQKLQEQGVLPWLDLWELIPGRPWQRELERQISNIKSAAVFVGMDGVGPWQQQELYGFLDEFVSREMPVIPVLLASAAKEPMLPHFLRNMTWVDFRVVQPDPLERLVWGITGKRPSFA